MLTLKSITDAQCKRTLNLKVSVVRDQIALFLCLTGGKVQCYSGHTDMYKSPRNEKKSNEKVTSSECMPCKLPFFIMTCLCSVACAEPQYMYLYLCPTCNAAWRYMYHVNTYYISEAPDVHLSCLAYNLLVFPRVTQFVPWLRERSPHCESVLCGEGRLVFAGLRLHSGRGRV